MNWVLNLPMVSDELSDIAEKVEWYNKLIKDYYKSNNVGKAINLEYIRDMLIDDIYQRVRMFWTEDEIERAQRVE